MDPQLNTQLTIITGLSGAGHSTALAALQDIGFETIDNLPISLIPALLETKQGSKTPLALGVDSRTADIFTPEGQQILENLEGATILFLECSPDVLLRRFSVTRRRHPLYKTDDNQPLSITDSIATERQALEPLKLAAHHVLNTSDLAPHELATQIRHYFSGRTLPLKLTISSFSYGSGIPADADMVFDMRFLKNPHYVPALRQQTGQDALVGDYIQTDPRFLNTAHALEALVTQSLAGFKDVGKSYYHLAFGCTGGKHRSVFMAETVAKALENAGYSVLVQHRQLGKNN